MRCAAGNAPCSWGVEFADAPSNPPWEQVLDETRQAGFRGTELGPVGYLPEDPSLLRDSLEARGLALIGGVLFRPFHDPGAWDELVEALHRTARMLQPLGAKHLVFIDSLSPVRSPCAGDSDAAPRLDSTELVALHERVRQAARIGRDEYGLQACLHAHAGGCIEFLDELEQALDAIDEDLLGVCLDTGHSLYAGFDPIALLRRYSDRVRYVHVKDLDKSILRRAIEERVGFYEACARGAFCNLGRGSMDFAELNTALQEVGYSGWLTVEQDRGPLSVGSAFDDARTNYDFLVSSGLAS